MKGGRHTEACLRRRDTRCHCSGRMNRPTVSRRVNAGGNLSGLPFSLLMRDDFALDKVGGFLGLGRSGNK